MATKKVASRTQDFVFIEAQNTYRTLLSYLAEERGRDATKISEDEAWKLWELASIPLKD